jgi:hypothetical protein
MTMDAELRAKLARRVAEYDAQHALIDYWWETTGWVRPDWEAIIDTVIDLYCAEGEPR